MNNIQRTKEIMSSEIFCLKCLIPSYILNLIFSFKSEGGEMQNNFISNVQNSRLYFLLFCTRHPPNNPDYNISDQNSCSNPTQVQTHVTCHLPHTDPVIALFSS